MDQSNPFGYKVGSFYRLNWTINTGEYFILSGSTIYKDEIVQIIEQSKNSSTGDFIIKSIKTGNTSNIFYLRDYTFDENDHGTAGELRPLEKQFLSPLAPGEINEETVKVLFGTK